MKATSEEVRPDDELQQSVASEDDERIRRAVRAWAEDVRATPVPEEASRLAEALRELASHASARVRQSVAEAADTLPSEAFDSLLAALIADGDHYVRAAITRAAKRRALQRKARVREDGYEKAAGETLAHIQDRYTKDARRLAERAMRRGTEYFVRMLHHEATKIMTPLEFSLNCLRSGLDATTLDRAALSRDVSVAINRYRHLWSIIDRARDATTTITPRFVDEALAPLVDEARAQLAARLGDRAAKLRLTVDVAPSLRVDAHRSALLQALQNFLQNAAEAYPDGAATRDGHGAPRTRRAGSQLEITVADRGIGMTEAQRESLFIPFGSRKKGGSGLGLIIARTMIEEVHGGSLTFESVVDVGTTVRVILPVRQAGKVLHG